jgi:hypothetical protein
MPSTSDLADPQEYQKIFHWAETQKDGSIPSFATRRNDPYKVCIQGTEVLSTADIPVLQYQAGFGNVYVPCI